MRNTYHSEAGTPPPGVTAIGILTAMRIAMRYRDRIPTHKQLMADYGMSRATAYRWLAALRLARGISA